MSTVKDSIHKAAVKDPKYQKLKNAILRVKMKKALEWSLQDDMIHEKDK